MKNIIIGVSSFIVLILLVLTLYTIQGRAGREEEIQDGLSNAMKAAGEGMRKGGPYESREAFEAAFVENLMQELDSASDVEAAILTADHEKGIICAQLTETFQHPNGKTGKVSCQRTLFIEKEAPEEEKKCYTATFYLDQDFTPENLYKTVLVLEGEQIKAPAAPQKEGAVFAGWKSVSTGEAADFTKEVHQEEAFYAVWR